MRALKVEPEEVVAAFDVSPDLFAPNGFLHGGALITLAEGRLSVVEISWSRFTFSTLTWISMGKEWKSSSLKKSGMRPISVTWTR